MSDEDKYRLLDSFRQYAFLNFGEFVSDYIIKDFIKMTKNHGGKRKGSGRPKLKDSEKKERTKVMRIPESKVDAVIEIIRP